MIQNKKILITGKNGYVGKSILKALSHIYDVDTICRENFDLNDNYLTLKWFENKYYDTIIHTAIKGGSRLKKDESSVLDNNIKMYLNLLDCKDHYNKFINIGSGAEITSPESFYGMSKKTIHSSIQDKKNFYSLRIFGIFDENEYDTRYIKNNLIRYIDKMPIFIHKNKYMDFIYMQDFITIIKQYIDQEENLIKNLDCVYNEKYLLSDIANIINTLDSYCVNINFVENTFEKNYMGVFTDLNLSFMGLEQGIKETYRKIKNEKNMVCS